MVNTLVLAGIFDGQHIADIFNNTQGGVVALGIGADIANLLVGNIVAHAAVPDLAPQFKNGFAQRSRNFGLLL